MENMTVSMAACLCEGEIRGKGNPEISLGRIVIDSRQVSEGDLFVAFRGERVDGHDFLDAAFARGAGCCLVDHIPVGQNGLVILVPDVQSAIEKIAAGYRQQFDIPLVGITGSVGKTTAKEMISAVLEQHFRILKTEGNLNNQIGIPMMLSRLNQSHQAAVIEMGISDFGEMTALTKMVRPTAAVFTVIGHAHLEFLGDLDGVLKAKSEMLEFLPDHAPVIVNGDDEKLRGLCCRQKIISCGLAADCRVRAENIRTDGTVQNCEIVCENRRIAATIPAYGKQYVYAALFAAAIGMEFGLSDEEIVSGIANFQNVGRRGDLIRTGVLTLLDDSYNANPDSVKCAIDTLLQTEGKRHLCMLGNMLELGENSRQMHFDVGRYALEKGVDLVLTSGEYAQEMSRAAGEKGRAFETREALIEAFPNILQPDDCILIKASKGSHFETVTAALKDFTFRQQNYENVTH